MSGPPESTGGSGHKLQFQLNIISPSPEVGRLNFPSISTSCTIAQLKQRISNASETRIPLPGQQRLIYRGHVLAQEQRTLADVFGQDTIDDSNEPLTIHLVFNPGTRQQPANPSPTPQARAQQIPTAQPSRTNPVANPQPPAPGTVPQATVEAPIQAPPVLGHNAQMQVPQGNPFPQLQQTFALMNQQIAAQMAALGANPMMQNVAPNQPHTQPPTSYPQPHQPHQPHVPHVPHVHHHHPHGHVHQPQTPQGIPIQGNTNMTPQQSLQYMAQQNQRRQQNQFRTTADHQATNMATQRSNSAPPPGLGNTNTVIRETYGPNGERHQSIVSSGTIQINHGASAPNHILRRRESSRAGTSRSETPSGHLHAPNQVDNLGTMPPTPLLSMQLQALQAHMSSMESAMNLGSIPPNSIQEQAQTLLRTVAPTISQQQYQVLESRRQVLSNRANAMQRNLDASLHRAAEQVTSQRNAQLAGDSAIYVLSSSNGPQALLVSPSGYYAAPWPMVSAPVAQSVVLPDPPVLNAAQNAIANAQQAHINAVQLAQAQPNGHQQLNLAEVLHPGQQQQQARAPDPARDIVRILIPLGGHLWLLIRLFGFVYFFTHGASWHRTILLSLVAFLLFIAQTGIFQPLLQHVWGPIRRHAEALLPLAGNEQPRGGDAPAAANTDAAGTQGRNGEPTPQEAAERLLREREAQDGNFVRQGLRRIERAVALFVASLVPGVGERHIAAREAAEAARQREEREREERARRDEQERQQAQGTQEPGPTSSDSAAGSTGEPTGGASSAQEQTAQPPLIEV